MDIRLKLLLVEGDQVDVLPDLCRTIVCMADSDTFIDAHRGGGEGGRGGRGAPHVPPIKIFEKLPHKNAIKHDPP